MRCTIRFTAKMSFCYDLLCSGAKSPPANQQARELHLQGANALNR